STTVTVNGWVKSVRRQKNIAFAVISDGSSEQGLQAVFADVTLAKSFTNGASVRLGGQLADSPGRGQDTELKVESVEVLGECDPEVQTTYPIQKQSLTAEYLREHCHLRARTESISSMLRLRNTVSMSIHQFFQSAGFLSVHAPILTSNDCEGAGETFRIAPTSRDLSTQCAAENDEFFGHPAYLTVSSQLHLEALAAAVSRVYSLSPCFRAERSQTSRHLSEFWMLEAEWAFTQSVDDVCQVVEQAIKFIIDRTVATSLTEDAEHLVEAMERPAWTRIKYNDAVNELAAHQTATKQFVYKPEWGKPLQSEHERWLADELVRGPVFVTDYPSALKPFYMRLNDDGRTVACFDLLMPRLGELVGGSLREERTNLLIANLEKHNLSLQEYGWYVDLRRFGGAPHGGFGLGFERLISWIGRIENVRECIAMPRW
ncbi:asparaginyl-tRNA synthetase, partial [Wolfiporia cocos MD-104 SS10]